MAIGVFDNEKGRTQRVRVNVIADLDIWPDETRDDIQDTLSYHKIVEHIQRLAKQGHIHLVETFATRIAEACLMENGVKSVMVRVEKLDIYDFAVPGAEIFRVRH